MCAWGYSSRKFSCSQIWVILNRQIASALMFNICKAVLHLRKSASFRSGTLFFILGVAKRNYCQSDALALQTLEGREAGMGERWPLGAASLSFTFSSLSSFGLAETIETPHWCYSIRLKRLQFQSTASWAPAEETLSKDN